MSSFGSKIQNLQMCPNIFFCASSYIFRNIIILNYWRLEMWSRSMRTIFENIFSKFVNNGEVLTMNFEYYASSWMEATHAHTYTYAHIHAQTHTHTYTQTHTDTRTRVHTQTGCCAAYISLRHFVRGRCLPSFWHLSGWDDCSSSCN